MLAVVHREVEEYLNTPGLYVDGDEEGFPNRAKMTGEYYIGDESYTAQVNPVSFQISFMCRCLEKPASPRQSTSDYLGLQVWLRCMPGRFSFEVFRNTDSSSI
jgi:hypothetical protein